MARNTGPKARVNRRLGQMVYESSGAVRAADRRESPPGMHTRGRRRSNFATALYEKQKVKQVVSDIGKDLGQSVTITDFSYFKIGE